MRLVLISIRKQGQAGGYAEVTFGKKSSTLGCGYAARGKKSFTPIREYSLFLKFFFD
jgi:hypothetical protein